jgi:hypothetical protein
MTITLPAVCPTEREFTCADYPVSEGLWRGGVAFSPKGWSDVPVSAALRLQYINIRDTIAAEFVTCWNQSLSGALPLTLPQEIVAGINDLDYAARILQPPGLAWKFSSAPAINSVFPGISSVQVELRAEADPEANVPRESNVFLEITPAQYTIYQYSGAETIVGCSNPFFGGSIGNGGGVSTSGFNNLAGEFMELEVYVPPTAARTCNMFYEIPPAEPYKVKVFGVRNDGTRALIYSSGPRFSGWYVDSISRTYANSVAGPVSVGIKNVTTGQKYGPWYNLGITQGYEVGENLGVSGFGSNSVASISTIPANWFDPY